MEAKKSPKADLENKKGLYLEIGLVVIIAAALVAFNIKSYDKEAKTAMVHMVEDFVEEDVIQTVEDTPPPPPEPEVPEVVTEVVVVENDAEIKNELGPIDMGDNANKAAETFTPIQTTVEEEVEDEEVFVFVEEVATFPEGEDALYEYLAKEIQYPVQARDGGIEGKVYVRFVVEKDGSITNIRIMRDIGGGCGEEAKRVVKGMPKWKPGKQRGRAVRSEFTLPVNFTLS